MQVMFLYMQQKKHTKINNKGHLDEERKKKQRESEGERVRKRIKKANEQRKVIKCQSENMGIDKQGNSRGVLNCNQYKTPHKTNLTFSFIDNRQTGSLLLKVEDNLWLWQPEKREIKWFQLQVYTDEWVNETISQCVYSFRGDSLILSGISHQPWPLTRDCI